MSRRSARAGVPSPLASPARDTDDHLVDWVRHWQSATFAAHALDWIRGSLLEVGAQVRGPLVAHRIRFWAAVFHVETDQGTAWFKACNPGQGFEAATLRALATVAPQDFVTPLATLPERGWLLLPEGGMTLRERGVNGGHWCALVAQTARVQKQLTAHASTLQGAGVAAFGAEMAAPYVHRLVDALAGLPTTHAQSLGRLEARQILDALAGVEPLFDLLAASGIPSSFQPNDVSASNAFIVPGQENRFLLFDVGDGFWSHPFAALAHPVRAATGSWPARPPKNHPMSARLRDAYLEPWHGMLGTTDATEVSQLVEAGDRLGDLHRCESWRRLLEHVPHDAVAEPPRLAYWLAQAVGSRA